MANRALIVEIIGDDRKLQQAFVRSQASAKQFGASMGRSLSSGVSVSKSFEPLLGDIRKMQGEAGALTDRLGTMGEGAESAGRGFGRLDASLIAVLGRATAFGFAVTTAYHASQRLTEALQQTGSQAFTTEGRLRNMAAALVQGDLLGAFEALRDQPKTLEELGISAVEAGNRLDALQAVANGTAERLKEQGLATSDAGGEFTDYNRIISEAGTANRTLARELVNQVAAIRAAAAAQDALADSTARMGTAFRTSTGEVVTFKGAVDDLGGLRGPGLVDQINTTLESLSGASSGRIARAIGPTAKNQAAQTIAQANEDLDELLRLQIEERDRLKKALANSTGNVQQRTALNQQLAQAAAAVISTQKALGDAATNSSQQRARKLAERWQETIGALDLAVSRADLTAGLQDDLSALKLLRGGLQRQIKAGVDVQTAQAQLITVTGRIAAKQQEVRDKAESVLQAGQFRSLGLSATGDEIIPGFKNLETRIAGALRRISSGEEEVSSKLVDRLKLARSLIKREGSKLTAETRSAINDLIKTVTGGFDELEQVSQQTFRRINLSDNILKALGFDKQAAAAFQGTGQHPFTPKVGRVTPLRPVTATTGAGVTISGPVTVVANDPDAFLRELQKKAGRTSATARGRFPGRSLGLG